MPQIPTWPALVLIAALLCTSCDDDQRTAVVDPAVEAATSALDFTMTGIDGTPVNLAQMTGKVVMIVNVASQCHFTPQYAALEKLYLRYAARGLVIIGVPANNFFHQEPGSDLEIRTFCSDTYHVTFPMLAKVSVKGDDMCPLYRYLTTKSARPGAISWNFNKFLIDRRGQVVERFGSTTDPDDAKVIAMIESCLQ
jgi:glutathione peroxidase